MRKFDTVTVLVLALVVAASIPAAATAATPRHRRDWTEGALGNRRVYKEAFHCVLTRSVQIRGVAAGDRARYAFQHQSLDFHPPTGVRAPLTFAATCLISTAMLVMPIFAGLDRRVTIVATHTVTETDPDAVTATIPKFNYVLSGGGALIGNCSCYRSWQT